MLSIITLLLCSIILQQQTFAGVLKNNDDDSITVLKTPEDMTIDYVESFDFTNKLLFDLEQFLEKNIKKVDEPSSEQPQTQQTELSFKNAEFDGGAKDSQGREVTMGHLIHNLNDLDKKLSSTYSDLQSRRRFVLSAMVRQMQTTVRRLRFNVSRMQTQLSAAESIATAPPLIPRPLPMNQNITSLVDNNTVNYNNMQANKELVEQIEDRINVISKKINEIITRLNDSLHSTGTNVDVNNGKPINPIHTLNSIIHQQQQQQKHVLAHLHSTN